jgi:hypothetical protein
MQDVKLLRVVVASPNDVQAERNALPLIVDELNSAMASDRGLRLEIARWETDAYPGFHLEGPQALIDRVLHIEDCDILIGIFWKRFGTPVKDAGSGTDHEFRRAYAAWRRRGRPHIMMYFNQQPFAPQTKAETDQWGQVLEFRHNFPKEGLWWPYKGKIQFARLARHHLTQFIRTQLPGPAEQHPDSGVKLPPDAARSADISPLTAGERMGSETGQKPQPSASGKVGDIKDVAVLDRGKIHQSDHVTIHIGHSLGEQKD